MKIKFDKLETSNESIKVSFNGGSSYENFGVENIRKRGIILDDSQNYGKIRIVGKSTVLKNLDVVKDICIPNKTFFLVDMYNNGGGLKRRYIEDTKAIVEKIPEAELSFDKDGEVYEDYPSKEDNLPRINASGIMVSILWLQDVFGTETFDAECLVNEYNDPYKPFGYLQNGQPLLYVFDIFNHRPIVYNDGTTQKYFYPSLIESENVAKELPTFRILLEDETVLEEKTIYIDYVSDKLYQVINDRPDDFSGYDWEVFRNVWEDYDEESDSYTESFQRYSTIIDEQVNVWDSLWLDNDLTLRICNKQEHVYHYNARYVDDQSKFSISFTKNNPKLPDTPTKPFATFLGWYQDSSFYTPLNLGDIDSDSYIYAKWEYHNVTRKIIFERDNIHFEFEVTKTSNLSLRTSDLINYIREQDTTGCIKSISSRSNYTLYFNTDDDYIIPEDAYSISYTQKTIVVKYSDGSSQSFTYTPAPCTIGCKYEDILPNHTKSILQDSQIIATNGVIIDSQETLDTYMNTVFSSVTFNEDLIYLSEIKLEFVNYDITNTSLSNNPVISSTSHTNISLNTAVDVNVYVSTEPIDKLNYKDAHLICSGKDIQEAYEAIAAIENNTSIPSISKIYVYLECQTMIGSIKFNYIDRNGFSANTTSEFKFGKNLIIPDTYESLDELLNNALSTSRYSSDLDTTIPDNHTYKVWINYNNKNYYPGETINVPEVPKKGENIMTVHYLPVAINYDSNVKLLTRSLIGQNVETDVDADVSFVDSNLDYITSHVKYEDTDCDIKDIDNCIKDNNNRIFRTPYEKSIKFTVSNVNNKNLNYFFGIGSNDDAKSFISNNIDIPFFNGIGEELSLKNKQRILSQVSSSTKNNENYAMFLEEYLADRKKTLPYFSESCACAFIISEQQRKYCKIYNKETPLMFYYGVDYDDTWDNWIIPGNTKYVELYLDVDENHYYSIDLTKSYNVLDQNKIYSISNNLYHLVNPDAHKLYLSFQSHSKPYDYNDLSYVDVDDTNSPNDRRELGLLDICHITKQNGRYFDYYGMYENWTSNVIAGEDAFYVIKFAGDYYKVDLTNRNESSHKVKLELTNENRFNYDSTTYEMSPVLSISFALMYDIEYFEEYRKNKSTYYLIEGGNIVTSSSYKKLFKIISIEFSDWPGLCNSLWYASGHVTSYGSLGNISSIGSYIWSGKSDQYICDMYVVYKKGTGKEHNPRNLKYCIVEADAVEENNTID